MYLNDDDWYNDAKSVVCILLSLISKFRTSESDSAFQGEQVFE